MEPFNWNFNPTSVVPRQGGGAHPVGNKFPFRITDVEVKQTKDNSGGYLAIEFTSDAGSIVHRYNLWSASEVARRIATEQLSAACYAVNRIVDIGPSQGKVLIGGQGLMDVGFQKGHEPSAEKPEGGYVELKKVYDAAGNEPGRTPVQQQQPQQQNGNGFGQQVAALQQPVQQTTQTQSNPSWGDGANAAGTTNTTAAGNANWGGANGSPPASPPWGSK